MRKSLGFVTATLLVATPVHARDWADQTTGRQTGAFVGAQLHVPLSGKTKEQPRASLGVAPTFTRVSTRGVHTSIGEGLQGKKFVLAPYDGLPSDGVALTAWRNLQTCRQANADVASAFVNAYMLPGGDKSVAPEPNAA